MSDPAGIPGHIEAMRRMRDCGAAAPRALAGMVVLSLLLSFAPLEGCKSNCSIEAADYDQACQTDSDCVAVFSGSFCAAHTCACENAAISVSSYERYTSDLEKDDAPRCPCPPAPPVACNQGTCGLRGSGAAEAGAD